MLASLNFVIALIDFRGLNSKSKVLRRSNCVERTNYQTRILLMYLHTNVRVELACLHARKTCRNRCMWPERFAIEPNSLYSMYVATPFPKPSEHVQVIHEIIISGNSRSALQ